MSEKRFEVVLNEFDEVEYIMDKVGMEDRDFADFMIFVEELAKENEQLQKNRNNLAEECSELFKQNGRLKKENEKLREDLGFSEKYSQNPVDYKM